jgi:hypothetical protein
MFVYVYLAAQDTLGRTGPSSRWRPARAVLRRRDGFRWPNSQLANSPPTESRTSAGLLAKARYCNEQRKEGEDGVGSLPFLRGNAVNYDHGATDGSDRPEHLQVLLAHVHLLSLLPVLLA